MRFCRLCSNNLVDGFQNDTSLHIYIYIQYQDDNQPGIDRIDNTLKKDYENHDIFGFDSIC